MKTQKLQREFLTLSTVAHGVLIAILFFGTAFFSKPKPPEETEPVTLLDFVPDELVDENVAQRPGTPPRQRTAPPARPPQTPPAKPEPRQPEPRTPAPAKPKPPKPAPAKPKPKPAPKRWKPSREIKVNLKKVRRTDTEAQRRAERARQQREAARRELARSLSRLEQQLTAQVRFSVPGVGGASYANYGAYVRTIYDRAWREPSSTTSAHPVVKAQVVIARDGRVISAKILRGSGDPGLDRTVRDALNRVKNIGRPFPRGAKDQQRSFILNFNLEAKHALG